MKPEEQRIALAKACGWKSFSEPLGWGERPSALCGKSAIRKEIPDFLNDLNAVHEAERYLADNVFYAEQWADYGKQLEFLHDSALITSHVATSKNYEEDLYCDVAEIANTPASVRVEALLKTLKLWTDE